MESKREVIRRGDVVSAKERRLPSEGTPPISCTKCQLHRGERPPRKAPACHRARGHHSDRFWRGGRWRASEVIRGKGDVVSRKERRLPPEGTPPISCTKCQLHRGERPPRKAPACRSSWWRRRELNPRPKTVAAWLYMLVSPIDLVRGLSGEREPSTNQPLDFASRT